MINKDRLECPIENLEFKDLIGAKVKVNKLSMSTGRNWNNKELIEYTVEDIKFRISTDGKCFTIVYLKELPGLSFTLKDIILCQK